MARKFDSEIYISQEDIWIFRGKEIFQEEILKYFRKNLREDESGVYIDNRFGELAENGYVKIDGFPLHIIHVAEDGGDLFFSTDSDRTFVLENLDFYQSDKGEFFCKEKGKEKILYRFSRQASVQLSDFLEETEDGYKISFASHFIPLQDWKGSVGVEIPEIYKTQTEKE
jgi:hypothetical protein